MGICTRIRISAISRWLILVTLVVCGRDRSTVKCVKILGIVRNKPFCTIWGMANVPSVMSEAKNATCYLMLTVPINIILYTIYHII